MQCFNNNDAKQNWCEFEWEVHFMNKSNLRIIFIVVCLLVSVLPHVSAATEAEIVASFKQLVSEAMAKALVSYEGNVDYHYVEPSEYMKNGVWNKTVKQLNTDYKIDVKRTDSLISPYNATLEVVKEFRGSNYYPTKEGAANASTTYATLDRNYVLFYSYQEGVWVFTKPYLKITNLNFKSILSNILEAPLNPKSWDDVSEVTFEILKMR